MTVPALDGNGDDVRTCDGYRHHVYAKSTGGLVVLVDGHAQGLSSPGDGEGRWFLICDRHSTLLSDTNEKRLRTHMHYPHGWCSDCYEALAD